MDHNVDALGVKIIHWELEHSFEKISSIKAFLRTIPTTYPASQDFNGIQFRFNVKVYQGKKLTLNCIAEEVFICDTITSMDFNDIKDLMLFAFNSFDRAFKEKNKSESFFVTEVIYNPTDDEVRGILQKLRKG